MVTQLGGCTLITCSPDIALHDIVRLNSDPEILFSFVFFKSIPEVPL